MTKNKALPGDDWDAIIGLVYDCATDPSLWPELLATLTRLSNGHAAVLNALDLTDQSGSVFVENNTDPSWSVQYKQYYAALNPSFDVLDKVAVYKPFTFHDLFGWEAFSKTPYHCEYRHPQGFGDSLNMLLERNAQRTLSISIFRPAADPLYQSRDLRALRKLAPHIRRALEIGRVIGAQKNETETLAGALCRLTFGLVLLDQDRRVAFCNEAAETLISERHACIDRGGVFGLPGAGDTRWLVNALAGTAENETSRVITARDGSRLLLRAIMLGKTAANAVLGRGQAAQCLLIMKPLDASAIDHGAMFAHVHGLSAGERKVFHALCHGQSIAETSEALALSAATVRSHLKKIFLKTGTHRQSELLLRASSLDVPMK